MRREGVKYCSEAARKLRSNATIKNYEVSRRDPYWSAAKQDEENIGDHRRGKSALHECSLLNVFSRSAPYRHAHNRGHRKEAMKRGHKLDRQQLRGTVRDPVKAVRREQVWQGDFDASTTRPRYRYATHCGIGGFRMIDEPPETESREGVFALGVVEDRTWKEAEAIRARHCRPLTTLRPGTRL